MGVVAPGCEPQLTHRSKVPVMGHQLIHLFFNCLARCSIGSVGSNHQSRQHRDGACSRRQHAGGGEFNGVVEGITVSMFNRRFNGSHELLGKCRVCAAWCSCCSKQDGCTELLLLHSSSKDNASSQGAAPSACAWHQIKVSQIGAPSLQPDWL